MSVHEKKLKYKTSLQRAILVALKQFKIMDCFNHYVVSQ